MLSHTEFLNELQTKTHVPWLEGRTLEYKNYLPKGPAFTKIVETISHYLTQKGQNCAWCA